MADSLKISIPGTPGGLVGPSLSRWDCCLGLPLPRGRVLGAGLLNTIGLEGGGVVTTVNLTGVEEVVRLVTGAAVVVVGVFSVNLIVRLGVDGGGRAVVRRMLPETDGPGLPLLTSASSFTPPSPWSTLSPKLVAECPAPNLVKLKETVLPGILGMMLRGSVWSAASRAPDPLPPAAAPTPAGWRENPRTLDSGSWDKLFCSI